MSNTKIEVEIDFTNPAQVVAMCTFMKAMEASAGNARKPYEKEATKAPVTKAPVTKAPVTKAPVTKEAAAPVVTEPDAKEIAAAVEELGDSVRTLITSKVQTNRPAIKAKLDELGVPNVTKLIEAKDMEKLQAMKTFLEGLK